MATRATGSLAMTEEVAALVGGAFEARLPMLVAYVGDNGFPRLSFRGTLQVHGDDALAFWARNPEGGVVKAIAERPKLTVFYRNPEARTTVFFYGEAHLVTDAAERDAIYDNSPEPERNADADKAGVAIVVVLDAIEGRNADGPFSITRS